MLLMFLGLFGFAGLSLFLMCLPIVKIVKGMGVPSVESQERYKEKLKMERKAEIMALAEGYDLPSRVEPYGSQSRQTTLTKSNVVKQSWTYNPNIHFNIHNEIALRNSLSFPGRHFRIYTSHSGVQGSPMLNSTSYVNINGNHRLTEEEDVIVHRVEKFKEGNDEGLEIRYTSHRGYSRTGRFYFTPNMHCSYDNFIYRMEEL